MKLAVKTLSLLFNWNQGLSQKIWYLKKAEHSKEEIPLFNFNKISLMTVPNLFIIPNTSNQVSLKWHEGSYETMYVV